MTDTYAFLIREPDWDSDRYLAGAPDPKDETFAAHAHFQQAVAELGATIVGGTALHNAKHGGRCTPGAGEGRVADAVYTDVAYPDASEVITGFYLVETADEDTARRIAAMVPTGNSVEWRKVFPMG